jgi:hypothetical protein
VEKERNIQVNRKHNTCQKNHPSYLIMMGAGKKGNKVVFDGHIEMDT